MIKNLFAFLFTIIFSWCSYASIPGESESTRRFSREEAELKCLVDLQKHIEEIDELELVKQICELKKVELIHCVDEMNENDVVRWMEDWLRKCMLREGFQT